MNIFVSKAILLLALALSSQISFGIVQNREFSRIFVFGDSLSDIGNTSKLFHGLFPKSPPYYKGRLSNGHVWVEHFTKGLNLPAELVINYAFAGARANKGKFPVPSLDKQIAMYIKWNKMGADSNALYVVWIGSNDIINDENKHNDTKVVAKISEQVKKQLMLLIKHGARTFLIPNLPAISLSPLALERDAKEHSTKYSRHLDKMTINYNNLLQDNLNNLLIEYPQVKFFRFDTYSTVKNAAEYAAAFGINNISQRCNPNWYLDDHLEICKNPNNYLFWDTLHPSAVGHKLLTFFITNTINNAGYLSKRNDYILTNEDEIIFYNNNMALQELTERKLNLIEHEDLLRDNIWF